MDERQRPTTRRHFLRAAAAGGAGLYAASKMDFWKRVMAQVPGGTLPPDVIPKFVTPLTVPRAMPLSAMLADADYYEVAVRQFRQQILPTRFPDTTVWGYGSLADATSFGYPAPTFEARAGRAVRVKWVNQLVDASGKYLPHLLPVDQTLHWAHPPGGVGGRDMHGHDPAPYRGPVPIVTHLHGAHAGDESDGYPEAWYLPAASNLPAGYATAGTWYEYFRAKSAALWGGDWAPGSATFTYPNDQRAGTLWYHDHALGLTRVNVYAGPAGFYLIRGGPGDLPPGTLPAGDHEVPLVIQDRSFNANGSLFYPDNRAFFEGLQTGQLQIPYIPRDGCTGPSDVSPIWNPEFFGNAMVVNGRTWPYFTVEQRRYRFRILNASDSRFLILRLSNGQPFWQVGADGGFLGTPAPLSQLLIAPAERADVVVDFSGAPVGTEIVLLNAGPDEPFGGGVPGVDFDAADPATTGLVMQFRVVPAPAVDGSTHPADLVLPAAGALPAADRVRQLSLNEAESETVFVSAHPGHGHPKRQPKVLKLACGDADGMPFGPTMALLGTVSPGGDPSPMRWMDAVTETPGPGDTEVWEMHNFTEDAHPIHVHLVQFEIVGREDADGNVRDPEPWESGRKDTVIAYPGEVTRVKATFDRPGQFVWHCHILSHEDNEMMRPFSVGPAQAPTA